MMRRIVLGWLGLLLAAEAFAVTEIVNLRTETMRTPLGLDEARPYFSWQMRSDRTGALQRAYRVMVALSEEDLQAGRLVFDSGTVRSDTSLNIPYEGEALRGSTRYFWKVRVWDEYDRPSESAPTWFETGLMGDGWSRAEWIGSQAVGASKYRTFFNIDYDVQIPEGNSCAVFAYSAQDERNWIAAEFNIREDPSFIVSYCVEGEIHSLPAIPLGELVSGDARHAPHHIRLQAGTPGYHLRSLLTVHFDGRVLTPEPLVIIPYPNGERVHDWARLHSIGFRQPQGQKAVFSHIVLSEENWGTVLYADPEERREVEGDGRLRIWEPYGLVSAPMLRKEIEISRPLRSARLYVTARGIYEFYINGQRVGNDYYNPGWTDYRYRIMYNTYDITELLREGTNGLGAMLGSGWWSDLNIFTSAYVDAYGIRQSLLAKILLTYADGTTETVVSDGSWRKYDHGPLVRSAFQFGEDYDARKEADGWTESGFDDSAWEPADIFGRPAPGVRIQAYVGLPVQNNITLEAVGVSEPVRGTFVYDFGQNVIGVPRLEGLRGAAGQVVNLRYGEMIYPERIPDDPVPPYTVETYRKLRGQVYTENYRGALSIDNYILRGRPEGETYQPVFTDHGFRYLSVTGLDRPLPLSAVKAVVLESIGETTAEYESSDPVVNRLFENILWGQRDNFQSVPTDCPQRDERQGWTGDAQVFARTATYYSPWVDKFYARWLCSVRDNQNLDGSYFNYYPVIGRPPYGFANDKPGWIGWMEAGIVVPYQVWEQYGDIRVLEDHWDSMVRYMDYLERIANPDGTQIDSGIGDHLALERTDAGLTNTAYYAYDAYMMRRIAEALGKAREARRYAALFEKVKAGFVAKYMREDGMTVAPDSVSGERLPVDTQTSYALPLRFGLLDGALRERAVQRLVEDIGRHGNTLTTGFIGTPYLNLALSENGRDDLAYALFEQTRYPSWLYPVLQGATTMWERWNSYTLENGFGDVDMNSFNHYAYGAIGEWIWSHQLGIQRDEDRPAYKHILLQPKIGGSERFARGAFESPYGRIESGWEKSSGGYVYRVTVPANTTASLTLQADGLAKVFVRKGLEGVGEPRALRGRVLLELDSGSYVFEVKY